MQGLVLRAFRARALSLEPASLIPFGDSRLASTSSSEFVPRISTNSHLYTSIISRTSAYLSNVILVNGRSENKRYSYFHLELETKISEIFISIGIPPHIKGYNYLREGIKMTTENPYIINSVTKELYPSIAKKFCTTSSKVERAIRHAIEVAWNRGRIDAINAIFGARIYLGSEKPTNSEFIALVADKLILENLV